MHNIPVARSTEELCDSHCRHVDYQMAGDHILQLTLDNASLTIVWWKGIFNVIEKGNFILCHSMTLCILYSICYSVHWHNLWDLRVSTRILE